MRFDLEVVKSNPEVVGSCPEVVCSHPEVVFPRLREFGPRVRVTQKSRVRTQRSCSPEVVSSNPEIVGFDRGIVSSDPGIMESVPDVMNCDPRGISSITIYIKLSLSGLNFNYTRFGSWYEAQDAVVQLDSNSSNSYPVDVNMMTSMTKQKIMVRLFLGYNHFDVMGTIIRNNY